MAKPSLTATRREQRGEHSSPAVTPPLTGLGMSMVRGATAADTSVADRGRWVLPIAMKALDRVMSRKEAALLMDISEPRVSDYAKGTDDKTFSLLKLGALGDSFWVAFADELRGHYKLDDPAERVQHAVDLIGRGMAALIAETKR